MLNNQPNVNNELPDCLAQGLLIPYLSCCVLTHIGLLFYRNYLDKHNLQQEKIETTHSHNMTAYALFVLFLMGGWVTFVIVQDALHPLHRDEHGRRQHVPDWCNREKAAVIAATSLTLFFNQKIYEAGKYFCGKNVNALPPSDLQQNLIDVEGAEHAGNRLSG